jgi:CRP-like cAMP-binding protein
VALGDSLSHHGERQHAWFGVLEGLIKWAITARDGRTVTLGGQSVGSWFGEGTLIRDAPRQSDLVALRYSRVAMIPYDTFDWLRHNRPSFNNFLLQQVNLKTAVECSEVSQRAVAVQLFEVGDFTRLALLRSARELSQPIVIIELFRPIRSAVCSF